MSAPLPLAMEMAPIEQAAQALWPDLRVEWVASIDSTNSELMRRAAQGRAAPCVLVAGQQTAGRGRRGKPWEGRPDAMLAFSIGLPLAPADWSGLSLVVGVALVSALSEWARAQPQRPSTDAAARLGLKWPNDVWLMDAAGHGRKMAGILIETAAARAPQAGRYAVIGIGLNLCTQPVASASVPPTSVAEWAGTLAEPAALLQVLVGAVLAAVRDFEACGFAVYQSAFSAWDLLQGQQVRLSDGRSGQCLGVDAQGELLLATESGVERVTSGEVSVRPQPGSVGA